jgi:DNA-binding MarR family transcriptional regulator
VDVLLALGLTFQRIEASLGRPRAWLSLDLTMAQLKAVMLIVDSGGVPSRTLAERLGTTRSAITPLVDRLVAQGLVRREPHARDRRMAWVRPTAKAEAVQQMLLQTRRPVLQRVWDDVPADARVALMRSLTTLLASAQRVLARQHVAAAPSVQVRRRTRRRLAPSE